MTYAICSLSAVPPKGWRCLVCNKGGDAHDLITHEGCNEEHIFHRECYLHSLSAEIGKCQECDARLHKRVAVYTMSDADLYRMRNRFRHLRSKDLSLHRGVPFDGTHHGKLIRSTSWDGPRKEATTKQIEFVADKLGFATNDLS